MAPRRRSAGHCLFLNKFNVQCEALQFLEHHIERFGQTRFQNRLALHDSLVHPCATDDIIGLHSQHFLQSVRGAVSFQSPDFHLTQTLTTKLRLAAQRLLRDERVWSRRARVDLVVHKVVKFQHVDNADGDRLREAIARLAVEEPRLPGVRQSGLLEQAENLFLGGAIEYRRRCMNAPSRLACHALQILSTRRGKYILEFRAIGI